MAEGRWMPQGVDTVPRRVKKRRMQLGGTLLQPNRSSNAGAKAGRVSVQTVEAGGLPVTQLAGFLRLQRRLNRQILLRLCRQRGQRQ